MAAQCSGRAAFRIPHLAAPTAKLRPAERAPGGWLCISKSWPASRSSAGEPVPESTGLPTGQHKRPWRLRLPAELFRLELPSMKARPRPVPRLVLPCFSPIRPRCFGASKTRRDERASTELCSPETQWTSPARPYGNLVRNRPIQPWKSNCKYSEIQSKHGSVLSIIIVLNIY